MSAHEKAPAAPVSIEIRRGEPNEEELAAVIAVVSEIYAAEARDALAPPPARVSGWLRSARAPRRVPQPGSIWGRFEG